MKKVYLLYDARDLTLALNAAKDLESYGYKIISPVDDDIRDFNSLEDSLVEDNILLILNYHGAIKDPYLSFWTKFFYENNQAIALLNDCSKYEEMDLVNNMDPIILNGDITKIRNMKNNLLNYFTKDQLSQLKNISDLYTKAFLITSVVFKDKKDKSGQPHFNHLFRVSQKLDVEKEQVAGLLHDILEDTEVTSKDLKEVGIPEEIIKIVKIVTKTKIDKTKLSEEEKLQLYNEEINKIIATNNIHAIRLKYADMTDNFDPERLKELPQEKQEWFNKKYGPQLVKLKIEKKKGDIL